MPSGLVWAVLNGVAGSLFFGLTQCLGTPAHPSTITLELLLGKGMQSKGKEREGRRRERRKERKEGRKKRGKRKEGRKGKTRGK